MFMLVWARGWKDEVYLCVACLFLCYGWKNEVCSCVAYLFCPWRKNKVYLCVVCLFLSCGWKNEVCSCVACLSRLMNERTGNFCVKHVLSLPNEIHLSGHHKSTYSLTTRMSRLTRQPIADPLITGTTRTSRTTTTRLDYDSTQLDYDSITSRMTHQPIADPLITGSRNIFKSL